MRQPPQDHAPLTNRLCTETSPYLRQHQDNPVAWQAWSEATLRLARERGQPVLLSVGYAACHWCHVMARECFEDPAIAAVMNRLFVNIKVDREERPDIDQVYQAALAMMGQPGGWPLTLFLTPDGEPFWGGTYFSPEARYGRPGFPDILHNVAEVFHRQPDTIRHNATVLRQSLARLASSRAAEAVTPAMLDSAAVQLLPAVDPVRGGLAEAPKFPQCSLFELFWRSWLRHGTPEHANAVLTTLTHMCQGGIYDHLGGGFARYATDAHWLVPHFEKMLYDNAQLVDLLTLVWQETRIPLFAARVRETVDWILREMVVEGGGFAGTLDADSGHEEGRFYVWTAADITTVLGDDANARLFQHVYGVLPGGNWDGVTILNRLHARDMLSADDEARLADARAALWRVREQRERPGRDDKVLADWNGLAIAALARAAQVFDKPAWLHAAERAFTFVVRHLRLTADTARPDESPLSHSWCAGRAAHPATLDDYAALARAALVLQDSTGLTHYGAYAANFVTILDHDYWDAREGGYFFTAHTTVTPLVRHKHAADNATPSGNGLMLGVLARLYALTGLPAYQQRAEALVRAFSGEIHHSLFPLATWLNGVDDLLSLVSVAVIGPPVDSGTLALRQAVWSSPLPNRILLTGEAGHIWPESHPLHGKTMVDGLPTAYICQNNRCSPPVTDPAQLAAHLQQRIAGF